MTLAALRPGISIGALAKRVLRGDAQGEVIAVFRRSFYVRFDNRLVCVGCSDIGNGPLNLLCATSGPCNWGVMVSIGERVSLSARCLKMNNVYIPVESATLWVPPKAPAYRYISVRRGLNAVEDALPVSLPEGGLAQMLRSEEAPVGAWELQAFCAIDQISSWVTGGCTVADMSKAVGRLLGLGPGLTPSGDDFLAGALAMLHFSGETALLRQLSLEVAAQSRRLTNEISIAHLAAASKGMLSAELHDAVIALLDGSRLALDRSFETMAMRAHYSPWDTLVGVLKIGHALSGTARRNRLEAGRARRSSVSGWSCQKKLG